MMWIFAASGWLVFILGTVLDNQRYSECEGRYELQEQTVGKLCEEKWQLQDANHAYEKLVDNLRDTIDDKDAEILRLMAKMPKRGPDGKWSRR